MALLGTSPMRGGEGTRRALRWAVAAALAGTLVLLAAAPGAAAAEGGGPQAETPFDTLGQTVLTALARATNADEAIGALGNSLALNEARKRIAAEAEAAAEAPPAKPGPAAPTDPAEMPPASAGSNGSLSPSKRAAGAKIFAHSRADDGLGGSNAILLTGIALAPPDAPEAVKGVINNANTIVGRPYVWGGGHDSFYSSGYDCSGAVSFALFGGGLIPEPLASVPLESWGAPGPGKWITVYANAGHAFAEIAGLRWDTVGDAQGTGPRWHLAPTSTAGFVARHPPGL
jgi:cell wall-associated NlpC family hydrolase